MTDNDILKLAAKCGAVWPDETECELTRRQLLSFAQEIEAAERERIRAYFRKALADKGIVWPGEVDILYDKCFAAPYVPDEAA